MAMFLSRIKKALNLGTKSITANGTYNASTDGYDGYSSVEVNVAGVTPAPITPSNASPAALTSGTAVSPTANGYAIESYYTITPSNTPPVGVPSGQIVKMNGFGVISASMATINPVSTPETVTQDNVYHVSGSNGIIVDAITNITPSSTPVSVSNGDNIHIGGSGVIVNSIPTPTSITPSNSSPVALSANTPVKPTASGYAISSYSSKTPSDSSPASVSSGAIIKASASGYLYSTVQPKVATGTFTRTTSSANTINCGFTPDMIILMKGSGTTTTISTGDFRAIYWKDWSTSYVVDDYRSSSGYYLKNEPVSDFFTFTSTGFIYAKASSSTYAGTVKYIAVKYS